MRAYPKTKRLAVLAARDRGMRTGEVARKYGCSESWVRRVVQHRRELGKYGPYKFRRRNRHGGTPEQRIALMVREEPRLTVRELQQVLGTKLNAELVDRVKFNLHMCHDICWYGGIYSELVPSPTGDFVPYTPRYLLPLDLEHELEALSKEA